MPRPKNSGAEKRFLRAIPQENAEDASIRKALTYTV